MAWVFLRSWAEGALRELVQLQSSFLIFGNITAAGKLPGSLKSPPQKRRGRSSNESQIKGWLGSETEGKEQSLVFLVAVSKEILRQIMALGVFLKGLKQGEEPGEDALTPQHPSPGIKGRGD